MKEEDLLNKIETEFAYFEMDHIRMKVRLVEREDGELDTKTKIIRKDYIETSEEEWKAFRERILGIIKKVKENE